MRDMREIMYGKLRVRLPYEARFPFGSDGHAIVLWYRDAPLARLLADMETLAQGLGADQVMRAYTSQPEALTAVPAFCATHGYTLLPYQPLPEREGGWAVHGRYHFDIAR